MKSIFLFNVISKYIHFKFQQYQATVFPSCQVYMKFMARIHKNTHWELNSKTNNLKLPNIPYTVNASIYIK